jgi:hypothetical protein
MRSIRRFFCVLLVGLTIFAGAAHAVTGDQDNDGVPDSSDNCPSVYNPSQADWNANGTGDACDDSDKDGLTDEYEQTHFYGGTRQTNQSKWDTDGDGLGDGYEVNHAYTFNGQTYHSDPTMYDTDGDGRNDGTEAAGGTNPASADTDGDGYNDLGDNCPKVSNPDQKDTDRDGRGDACDSTPNGTPPPCDMQCQTESTVTTLADSAVGTASDAVDTVLSLLPDTRPVADLNRMATDGYVLRITQSGDHTFQINVVDASGAPVALNLPDLHGVYTINGPVSAYVYDPQKAPTAGDQLVLKWKYYARSKTLTIGVLLNHHTYTGEFVFSAPVVGYPTACGTAIPGITPTCDGNAVGFYNPEKLTAALDALDAVPYQTTIQ